MGNSPVLGAVSWFSVDSSKEQNSVIVKVFKCLLICHKTICRSEQFIPQLQLTGFNCLLPSLCLVHCPCVLCIIPVSCALSLCLVHYPCVLCIVPVSCALSLCLVHYPCVLCIIPVSCALSLCLVHYPCVLCIIPVSCALSLCLVHYPCVLCIIPVSCALSLCLVHCPCNYYYLFQLEHYC